MDKSIRIPVTEQLHRDINKKAHEKGITVAQAGRSFFENWISGDLEIQQPKEKFKVVAKSA